MPVIMLNISPDKCPVAPIPFDPMLIRSARQTELGCQLRGDFRLPIHDRQEKSMSLFWSLSGE